MGVRGHKQGLTDPSGGVHDGVGSAGAMFDSQVSRSQGDGFIQRDDPAVEGLRNEPFGYCSTALLCKVLIHLAQNDSGEEDGTVSFKVMSERGSLGILGEILEPAGRVYYIRLRGAPYDHGTRLSISSLWRCPAVL